MSLSNTSNETVKANNPVKNQLLVLCGVSGSGKSTLEQNLIEEYPDLFNKWLQVTTRKPRIYTNQKSESQGNPYIFIEKSTYHHLKDKLVGKLGLVENTLFKDLYGSIPEFIENKISTIILAEEGITDLKECIATGKIKVDNIFILGLDVSYDSLKNDSLREGRNKDFLDAERKVLESASLIYRSSGKYLEPKVVYELLKTHGFLNETN